MCGVLGWSSANSSTEPWARLGCAVELMRRRGPDDAGVAWVTDSGRIDTHYAELGTSQYTLDIPSRGPDTQTLIAHTRFSIVELSRLGRQPMLSPDGDLAMVFNGEIYNHQALRSELSGLGHTFRSHSDTEVLLHAYMQWGEAAFTRLIGWWAVALYDHRQGGVLLSRDRLGKAPLYVRQVGGALYWASELRTLLALTGSSSPNLSAASAFVDAGLRDVDYATFYEDITTFPAASCAWVRNGKLETPRTFWRFPTTRTTEAGLGIKEAVDMVHATIVDAVELRMQADVPVAVQLSGGLDSSVILACAAATGRPLQAVTVSFEDKDANEDAYASAAANAFPGLVDHKFIKPDADLSYGLMGGLVKSMGEPVHSPNQLASRMAWQHLHDQGYRVVMYGAGGDEVFAGYYGDYFAAHVRRQLSRGDLAGAFSNVWNLSERRLTPVDFARRVALLAPGSEQRFRRLRSHIAQDQRIFPQISGAPNLPTNRVEDTLLALMGNYRMNYWLRIDNQNSMQVPVELRSPFLDHRVVELAFSLPTSYLIRDGWMKWIMRKAFEKELPASVVWRKRKMGFPFPLKSWLQTNIDQVRADLLRSEAPGLNAGAIERSLELNIDRDPNMVWRAAAYALWWRQRPWAEEIAHPSPRRRSRNRRAA